MWLLDSGAIFIKDMIAKETVKAIVEEWLEGREYFLVDVNVSKDNAIVVEIDHADGVWIEDCVELSRFIESRLDRDVEDFELEVGSAGIGQPFKVQRQYACNVGREVEVLDGDGRKWRGVLTEAADDSFTVTTVEKVKEEGAKRPHNVEVAHAWKYGEVKYVKAVITFE